MVANPLVAAVVANPVVEGSKAGTTNNVDLSQLPQVMGINQASSPYKICLQLEVKGTQIVTIVQNGRIQIAIH